MKNLLSKVIVFVLLASGFKTLAQPTLPFVNALNCPVEVGYEMWETGCNGGVPCAAGKFTLTSAGGSYNLPLCPGYDGICVFIISIDGCAVPPNHESTSTCHVMIPYGTAGTLSSGCCNGISWNFTISNVNGFLIQ